MSEGPTEKQQAYIEYLSGSRHWWYAMAEYLGISASKAMRKATKADASRLIDHLLERRGKA